MARTRLMPVALAASVVVSLLGCSAPAPSVSPGSGTTPNPSSSANPSTAPDVDYSEFSVYYPIALGNTWTYRADYYGFNDVGIVIITEEVTELTPDPEGVVVTIERTFHHENGSFPDAEESLEFVFHDDGSAVFPFTSNPPDSGVLAGTYTLTVDEGAVAWPAVSDFETAAETKSTVTAKLSNGTVSFNESVVVTVTGEGSEGVTVPAGTFAARKLRQDIVTTVIGQGSFPSSVTTWFAEGVGPVRQIVVDELFGSEIVTIELVEFVAGS